MASTDSQIIWLTPLRLLPSIQFIDEGGLGTTLSSKDSVPAAPFSLSTDNIQRQVGSLFELSHSDSVFITRIQTFL